MRLAQRDVGGLANVDVAEQAVWCGRGVMEIESALVGGRLVVGGVQEATLGCMLRHSMQEAQQGACGVLFQEYGGSNDAGRVEVGG